MPDQEIHIIGYDEIILLMGLLGIEGTILKNAETFMKIFNDIIKKPSIGMVIIAMDLPNEIIDFLVDFKLHNRKPFIFYLPDIFQPEIERKNVFLKKISESISKIIR